MKGLICVLLGLLTLVFLQPAPLAAQSVKVGVVDLQKFQKNSKAFQRASLSVKKKFDDMQQKLNDERNAVSKLEEELKKQSMMLSLDAQEDKKRELEKKQRQFKFMYDEYSQEMKETEMEAIKKVMKELEKVVEDMGKKEGYTIILERRTLGLLYFNPTVDLTDRVTEAYDKQNP
ncbi:MAG: OmpH family outer membrane protein [Desulfobacterota bacterium]|nr:OmpH family outer membrane protein [Thermodesulfobacteriota bacterium]